MGIMTRMRDNAHWFIIAFAVVFILFWVISDVDVGSVLRGSSNHVGVVDGKPITYQEFTGIVERVAESQRKQSGGKDLEENQIASIREQVWSDYIQRAVIERAVKELGITVSDKEITDWVRSENPPEAIAQYFKDSTGHFNRDNYLAFLSNPGAENEQALVQIEEQLRSELLSKKLTTALAASMQIGDGELMEAYRNQNQQYNVSYVMFDPMKLFGPNNTPPSKQELQEYYDAHKYQFKNEEMRKLQFVAFLETPTREDTTAVMNEMENVAKEAKGGKDFLQLVKDYSETPYQDAWVTLNQLQPDQASELLRKPVGSIIGPMADEGGVTLGKILDAREGKETLVRARHILVKIEGGNETAAKAKIEEVLAKIRAGLPFDQAAKQFSQDPGSGPRGGDLGYFGKGRMIKAFEDACFNGKPGDVIGPIKTDFGYHLIKVEEKNNKEFKYAAIKMSVKASARTKDQAYENARNFAYFVQENGFEKEAQMNKYEIRETGEFAKQRGSYIPEIGVNPALVKWAFEGKTGDVSDVHRAMNGYVVCKIAEVLHAGYRPLADVEKTIAPQVRAELQLKKAGEVAAKYYAKLQPGRGLETILPPDSTLKLVTTGPFTMQQGPAVIGRDSRFLGRIGSMKAGEISKPFPGDRSYFIAQLISKSPVDEAAFKLQRDDLRRQQLQQKQSEYIQAWLEKMKDNVKIEDNRDRFFR